MVKQWNQQCARLRQDVSPKQRTELTQSGLKPRLSKREIKHGAQDNNCHQDQKEHTTASQK